MRRYIAVLLVLAVGLLGMGSAAYAASPTKERAHRGHMMGSEVHQAKYMQLLAEKYAPDTAEGWKKSVEERSSLMKQLHELRAEKKWDQKSTREKMKAFGEKNRDTMMNHKALAEQLTKAIQSNDDKAIRETLPKLLESEQKLNAALKEWVDKEK